MAVSDSKKVQTMINVVAAAKQACDAQLAIMLAVRTAFQTINPSVTGTPLAGGNAAKVNSLVTQLETLLAHADWLIVTNNIVPTHEGKALD